MRYGTGRGFVEEAVEHAAPEDAGYLVLGEVASGCYGGEGDGAVQGDGLGDFELDEPAEGGDVVVLSWVASAHCDRLELKAWVLLTCHDSALRCSAGVEASSPRFFAAALSLCLACSISSGNEP